MIWCVPARQLYLLGGSTGKITKWRHSATSSVSYEKDVLLFFVGHIQIFLDDLLIYNGLNYKFVQIPVKQVAPHRSSLLGMASRE